MSLENQYNSPKNQVNLLSLRNMATSVPISTSDGLTAETCSGKRNIRLTDFVGKLICEKPAFAIAFSDEYNLLSKKKQRDRSTIRNNSWFRELKQNNHIDWGNIFLFGVACGGNDLEFGSATKFLVDNNADGMI